MQSDELPKPSIFRRLWTINTMVASLLAMPIAMVLILSGPIYRRRQGAFQPISNRARYVYGGVLVLWLVAATAKAMLQPGGIKGEWERSADPKRPTTEQTAASQTGQQVPGASSPAEQTQAEDNSPPACTSEAATDGVKDIIENGATSKIVALTVEDFGKAQETIYEPARRVRRCVAEAILNTGPTLVTYQTFFGPSGKPMVQVQINETAETQYELDRARKAEIERVGQTEHEPQPSSDQPNNIQEHNQ